MAITNTNLQLLSQYCHTIGQQWQQFGELLADWNVSEATKMPAVSVAGGGRGGVTTSRVRNRTRAGGGRGLGSQPRTITQPTR